MSDLSADLELALHLADRADAITLARFGALDLHVEDKPDLTPVSDADIAVERELRTVLSAQRPADALLGEEFGGTAEFAGRQWVIDPIDGTKNFVRGLPVWCSLIALLSGGVPIVGVVSAPALSRRWWASAGQGAFSSFQGGTAKQISVSAVGSLGAASVSCLFPHSWPQQLRPGLDELISQSWRVRDYSDFLPYCFVAEGSLDIATEPEVSLWDLAALDILVREAGGEFTGLDGCAGPHHGSALATNGLLHPAVLSQLAAS